MSETKPILASISVHAWNKDRTQIAISPNNHEIKIYEVKDAKKPKTWTVLHTLTEHTQTVSGIDWNAKNQIVSCAHDRNAYVWSYDKDKDNWEPNLVILRINRSATSCKWSPLGNKIAVTSGSKWIQICYYEKVNNWWISKTLKKNRSTVTCVDWSPNNKFVITGGCDKKCRIYSAFIDGQDSEADDGFGDVWDEDSQLEFGEILETFDHAGAWINTVAWSPGGQRLAFSGHGATMHFIQLLAGSKPEVQSIEMTNLPFLQSAFLNDDTLVAVGFDMNPVVFKHNGSSWEQKGFMDDTKNKKSKAETGNKAMSMWQQRAKEGTTEKKEGLKTFHKNVVTSMTVDPTSSGTKFTLTSLDGRIIAWDTTKCANKDALGL